jgi:chromosome segregation ATPase
MNIYKWDKPVDISIYFENGSKKVFEKINSSTTEKGWIILEGEKDYSINGSKVNFMEIVYSK